LLGKLESAGQKQLRRVIKLVKLARKHRKVGFTMPRKAKPAAVRLLEGRAPGCDSGGRKVPIPPRPVLVPPSMPRGLPPAVRRQWRGVVKDLVERDQPMPPPEVLLSHCLCLVRQRETVAALEHEPAGTTTWRRLISVEAEIGKRIAAFSSEFSAPAARDTRTPGRSGTDDKPNPFGGRPPTPRWG